MAVGAVVAAVLWPGPAVLVAAGLFACGHVITIPNPSGRRVALTPAVAAATALVTASPVVVVAGYAIALPVGWAIIHLRFGRRVAADLYPAEPIGIGVFSGVFFGGSLLVGRFDAAHPLVLATFAVSAVAWFVAVVVVRSGWSRQRGLLGRRIVFLWALADWPAYAALFASAALYAVTVEAMGVWSIALAGLPYLFSHLSLDRVHGTRRTYDQTIRALGAIPEASGQVAEGHAGRVADLAVAVGSEIGLGPSALRRLQYASLLHDIGRVVLANPAVAPGSYSFADVSGWSAAIIAEARYLEPVAEIVAHQHAAYRKPGERRDPGVPVASQVVRVVARYDSAVNDGVTVVEAVELLHKGAAYDYDPQVVMALRRVLERRGAIAR